MATDEIVNNKREEEMMMAKEIDEVLKPGKAANAHNKKGLLI